MARHVALYARVSTVDQDPELQLHELRELAAARGWTCREYIDHGVSGSRFRRPALDKLLAEAQAGRVELVVVWRLDRLGRSLLDLVRLLHQFNAWSVGFISACDQGMDTTTPIGRLVFQLVAAFAEFEASLIRERTRAGLARARARGVQLGRPHRDLTPAQAAAALAEHGSERKAARALDVPRTTLRDRLSASLSLDEKPSRRVSEKLAYIRPQN